jgi:hypothetical protein
MSAGSGTETAPWLRPSRQVACAVDLTRPPGEEVALLRDSEHHRGTDGAIEV